MKLTKQNAEHIRAEDFARDMERWLRWKYGGRCPVFERKCVCCETWKRFDKAKKALVLLEPR